MDNLLHSLLTEAVPNRTPVEATLQGPSWNPTNETYRVTFRSAPPVFLKRSMEPDGTRTARECATLVYADETATPTVPDVLAADPSGSPPYLVTRPLEGQPFSDVWSGADSPRREELARRLGATVAALHETRLDHHGWFTLDDHGGADDQPDETDTADRHTVPLATDSDTHHPTVSPTTFTDLLVETIREHRRIAPTDRFDDAYDRLIAAVTANREQLDDAPAVLCHGDPAGPNFVIPADQAAEPPLLAPLDLEMAHAGDPARDLYRARDQTLAVPPHDAPEELVEALHDGYRARAGRLPPGFEARQPIYAAERIVGDAGFADKLAQWVDQSADAFDDWLRAEIDRRLTAIE